MRTLFVDSSRKSLSIALANDDKLIFVSNVESNNKHSNYLLNEIKNILTEIKLNINDIDNYVVLNGPGSFTGIRVGVTILKTISWTLTKKLYEINNLEALQVGLKDEVIISVIPDKKDNAYVGIYGNDKIEDYLNVLDDKLNIKGKNITIVSMQESAFLDNLLGRLSANNNVNVKLLDDYDYLSVINYALSKENINPHNAKPIYLKKIDAEKKKNDKML